MRSTRGNALFLPEILCLVCEFSEPQEWLSLLVTCRAIFPTVASHVWERLDGEANLTALLEFKKLPGKSIPIADWSRFDVYAPLVKHMTVYARTSHHFRGQARYAALSRSKREPLLPRLVSMTMLTSDLHHEVDSFVYMELFLSPSVTRIDIVPNSPSASARVSYPAMQLLLLRLTISSPNLKQLTVYPSDIAKDTPDKTTVLWTPPTERLFISLVHLRDITSSIMLVDGLGLAVLGALPQLERLAMYGSSREYPNNLETYVPGGSFPALVDLSLLQVDPTTMLTLMSVSPFVRHLTSLSLGQTFPEIDHSQILQQYEWLAEKMPRVLEHTTSLKRFSYNAGSYSAAVPRIAYNLQRLSLLEFMAPLPLEYVSLVGLSFSDEIFLRSMASAWPNLKELRIPDQHTPWNTIHWYTRIPKLQRLAVILSFSSLPSTWTSSDSPLEVLENTVDATEIVDDVVGADQAASFLVSLWPNLRQITWPHLGDLKAGRDEFTIKRQAQSRQFIARVGQLVKATHASKRRRN